MTFYNKVRRNRNAAFQRPPFVLDVMNTPLLQKRSGHNEQLEYRESCPNYEGNSKICVIIVECAILELTCEVIMIFVHNRLRLYCISHEVLILTP